MNSQRNMRDILTKRADGVVRHSAGSDHNHPLSEKGPVMADTHSNGAPPAPKQDRRRRQSLPTLDIDAEVAALQQMTNGELRERYAELFGEASRSRHKQYLIRRIAWRLQANAEGGLSERARQRAEELADIADIRVTPPRESRAGKACRRNGKRASTPTANMRRDTRLPSPGTSITRQYKGRTIEVRVLTDSLEFNGERYHSLSAVAKAITGAHCNGYRFFRLGGDS